ncbi:MAG: carboxypeptidase-like regulatory domain-containing protein, partial [Bacteroidota bacterium]|nr:carboxypeptidase-like regulatory domain-containing protein [Bacteroidota bacterium]
MKHRLLKMMRYACLLQLIFLAWSSAYAQGITIKGKVTGDTGEGLPGVTILLKGTTNGTATDGTGAFQLNAPNGNGTLVVSFIGYLTQEVPINNRTSINVTL